ncbi:MAG: hypothetical protein ACM3JD_19065 [Rudaea sp.]
MTAETTRSTEQAHERQPQAAPPAKKIYEKPAVIYRGPLEAMAGVCGTFPGPGKTTVVCKVNKS